MILEAAAQRSTDRTVEACQRPPSRVGTSSALSRSATCCRVRPSLRSSTTLAAASSEVGVYIHWVAQLPRRALTLLLMVALIACGGNGEVAESEATTDIATPESAGDDSTTLRGVVEVWTARPFLVGFERHRRAVRRRLHDPRPRRKGTARIQRSQQRLGVGHTGPRTQRGGHHGRRR